MPTLIACRIALASPFEGGSPGKQPLFLQAKAAIRSERARADVLAQTGENVVDFCLYGPPARGNTREVWKIDDSG